MKGKLYGLLVAVLILQLISVNSYAQNTFPAAGSVGIGTTTPNASSLLEVVSTSKGVLIPRMSKAQRDAIPSPATGLLIFQLNASPGFYFWNGSAWSPVSSGGGANKTLSNLQPTSISQNLNPSADNVRDLGTPSLRWNEVYFSLGNGTSADTATTTMHLENSFAGDGDAVALEAVSDVNAENGFGIAISASGGYIGSLGAGFIGQYGFGNFGIVGEALDTSADWAGYMLGDFLASNYFIPSDAKLKENTQPLSNNLEMLMQLSPLSYSYKTSEYSGMHLPVGTQMGLLAEDVEAVFPQLVKESFSPELRVNGTTSPGVQYKSVNYVALIPVMIGAMQEQQAVIEEQKSEISLLEEQNAELETRLRAIESKLNLNSDASVSFDRASLGQNAPNPFREKTTISYYLPATTEQAYIKVFALNGDEMLNIRLNGSGNGTVAIDAGTLSVGTYTYQLVVDGKTADTKIMVMTN